MKVVKGDAVKPQNQTPRSSILPATGAMSSARSTLEHLALRCETRRRQLYRQSERLRLLDATDQEPYRLWLQSREYHLFCRLLRTVARNDTATDRFSPGSMAADGGGTCDDEGSMTEQLADDAEIESALGRVMQSDLALTAKDRILSRYHRLRARTMVRAARRDSPRCS